MSIFHRIQEAIYDAAAIWREEMRQVFRDEGVFIFFIIVPIAYPLVYSWIYNNEVVREVPVVVIDNDRSHLSREFVRKCDASPNVHVKFYAEDLSEAKSLVSKQLVKGIYYIPSDFATSINRQEQGVVSVYCDMSLMMTYKAVYQTAVEVSQEMGAEFQKKLSGLYTDHEEAVATKPLEFEDVALFNPFGGQDAAAVLILILQQTLLLGIGLSAGTAREHNHNGELVSGRKPYTGVFRIVCGKALCYAMVYAVMATYLTVVIPRLFSFPAFASGRDLLLMLVPYIVACVFLGITVSCLVRYRENVMLITVFISLPLLYMSGVSWPQSNIPGLWQGVSWLFPTTFGIRAYVRLNSMGASLNQVMPELHYLWIQAAAYFGMACLVYGHQLHRARKREKSLETDE